MCVMTMMTRPGMESHHQKADDTAFVPVSVTVVYFLSPNVLFFLLLIPFDSLSVVFLHWRSCIVVLRRKQKSCFSCQYWTTAVKRITRDKSVTQWLQVLLEETALELVRSQSLHVVNRDHRAKKTSLKVITCGTTLTQERNLSTKKRQCHTICHIFLNFNIQTLLYETKLFLVSHAIFLCDPLCFCSWKITAFERSQACSCCTNLLDLRCHWQEGFKLIL